MVTYQFALEHGSLILADHHGPATNRVKKQATIFQNVASSLIWIFQQGY